MKKNRSIPAAIGVWMDHSKACLIDLAKNTGAISTIKSPQRPRRIFGEGANGTRLGNNRSTNNEYHKHEKEKNTTHAFYKKLADALSMYDEVFLFGPTTARREFRNYILKENLLTGKKVASRASDYLTKNQMMAEVRKYFKVA
jgi:hypothetical protein